MSSSIIMCISKILTDLCSIKQKIRVKNIFVRKLREHKEDCLMINGKQSVKLESGYIISNKYLFLSKYILILDVFLKKLIVILNIIILAHTEKNTKIMFLVVLLIKQFVLIINIVKKKLYRGKDAVNKIIKSILKEYNYCRSVGKKHFNKKLDYGCRRKLKI